MNTKRFLIGAVIGGIVYFFGGWLIWGNLLAEFMNTNSAPNINRAPDQMVWWALIVGNLMYGAVLSYVLNKTNANSMSQGMMTAGILGLLFSATIDFTMYATTNIMTSVNPIFVDIAATTVLSAVTGAIVAWSMHYLAKPAAETAH